MTDAEAVQRIEALFPEEGACMRRLDKPEYACVVGRYVPEVHKPLSLFRILGCGASWEEAFQYVERSLS